MLESSCFSASEYLCVIGVVDDVTLMQNACLKTICIR